MTDAPQADAVVALADAQLRAYNARDLDAFCACYAEDVVVLDADGQVTLRGMAAFRQRYQALFSGHAQVEAHILGRVTLSPHLVELERWHRRKTPDAPTETGLVLVRYTERQGRIAVVAFLR